MPHPKKGYHTKTGKRVPGVTTIINRFKNSSGLLYWAFEQGKKAERGEVERLYEERDKAGEAGTLAHEFVETYIKDGIIKFDYSSLSIKYNCSFDTIKQAEQGFENFKKWFDQSNLTVAHTEVQLVSEEHKFGGCNDLILSDNGRLAIGDIKTSNAIYPDHLIQIAAYGKLWDEAQLDDPITGGFHLLRFSKEHADFHHHYWSELDEAWEQFLLFRRAYEIDKKLKRRV